MNTEAIFTKVSLRMCTGPGISQKKIERLIHSLRLQSVSGDAILQKKIREMMPEITVSHRFLRYMPSLIIHRVSGAVLSI